MRERGSTSLYMGNSATSSSIRLQQLALSIAIISCSTHIATAQTPAVDSQQQEREPRTLPKGVQQKADEEPANTEKGEQTPAAGDAKAGQDGEQPPAAAALEGADVPTRDYGKGDEPPTAPGKDSLQKLGDMQTQVALNAGVGSTLAYGRATVVELGGTVALTHASDTTTFRLTPTLGYFVLDNVEVSLLPDFTVIDVDGSTDVTIGALVEPSYHLPVNDSVYAFIGLGMGLRYARDPGVDFALRPRLGMDVMIGRSGILKPAVFLDFGANDGVSQGGVEASFTVML